MPFYQKKPVVIEAMRFTEKDNAAYEEFIEWLARNDIPYVMWKSIERVETDDLPMPTKGWTAKYLDGTIHIITLEGLMKVNEGDYVIKGIEGEFYPCKPSIFEATYEALHGTN